MSKHSTKPARMPELLTKWEYASNPVTRCIYREIIGNKLQRLMDLQPPQKNYGRS